MVFIWRTRARLRHFTRNSGLLSRLLGRRVIEFSKHGSGRLHLGRHHYAPYEPERYLPWARQAGMRVFFGNLEDPELRPVQDGELLFYPSAFWLEPYWRDTRRFPIEWLLSEAAERDVVMLMHPDNVTSRRGDHAGVPDGGREAGNR